MENLSKIYKFEGWKFRYDYDNALLCWIDDDGSVLDEVGLSRDNWAENPEYWCEAYYGRINYHW